MKQTAPLNPLANNKAIILYPEKWHSKDSARPPCK